MLDYIKKLTRVSQQNEQLISNVDLSDMKNDIKRLAYVKSVFLDDETTLVIKLKKDSHGKSLLKNLGNGKLVLVTIWDVPAKERITYYIATTLWNDNKRGSHLTCSYITNKQLCVLESHLNIEWGVTKTYFTKWLDNYLSSIVLFTVHVDDTKEQIGKLPKSQLTLLEKLEVGAFIADTVSNLWNMFDS